MTKNKILLSLLIIICLVISSCNASKNLIQIKFSDLDSAIRTLIPSHHCGCTWKDEKTNIITPKIFKEFGYVWHTVYVRNMDSINTSTDSKKVYEQLKKIDNKYTDFKRFFLQYKVRDITDTTKGSVYDKIITPILSAKCYQCHSASKKKGNLRLQTIDLIMKGGKSGPGIKSGDAAHSELIKRILQR